MKSGREEVEEAQSDATAPAEQNSRNIQRHFTAIIESSDDAILSKDLNGIIQSWNKSAERIFGYSAAEVIGKSVTILIPTERLDEEPRILGRIRKGERVDHYETVRRRKDGVLIDISLTVSPIKDDNGVIVGASKIARDITERKLAQREIQRTQKELLALNETLDQRVRERTDSLRCALEQLQEFSYSVSHDLRAPVRAMRGYAEAILEDFGATLKPEVTELLRRIVRGSSRMDRLITDVLIYSRLAQKEIACKPVSLNVLVNDVVEHNPELQTLGKNLQIKTPLLDVCAHEALLTQVITNLLNNARKFCQPGVAPRIELFTQKHEDRVRIWVKDNGIGIDPSQHARIFEMFERLHPDYEGTGIGLAIVRKAVEKMGGTVGVESDGVNGSAFWVELASVG